MFPIENIGMERCEMRVCVQQASKHRAQVYMLVSLFPFIGEANLMKSTQENRQKFMKSLYTAKMATGSYTYQANEAQKNSSSLCALGSFALWVLFYAFVQLFSCSV